MLACAETCEAPTSGAKSAARQAATIAAAPWSLFRFDLFIGVLLVVVPFYAAMFCENIIWILE